MFYVIQNTPKSNFEMRVNIHVRAHSTPLHSLATMHAFTAELLCVCVCVVCLCVGGYNGWKLEFMCT